LTWGDSAWEEDSGWSFDLFGDGDKAMGTEVDQKNQMIAWSST
jgi:hypothetical protein